MYERLGYYGSCRAAGYMAMRDKDRAAGYMANAGIRIKHNVFSVHVLTQNSGGPYRSKRRGHRQYDRPLSSTFRLRHSRSIGKFA